MSVGKTNQDIISGRTGGERDSGQAGNIFDLPTMNGVPLIDPEVGERIASLIDHLESSENDTEGAGIQAEITRLGKFASRPPEIKTVTVKK